MEGALRAVGRVVVHLELPVDLRHHATRRDVPEQLAHFRGEVVALRLQDGHALEAARAEFGLGIGAIGLFLVQRKP